ncbi:MAG: Hsp20/alpha crystallin family protein [Deltaproteobacteria bacterium]|nr:Hsp20/alpha crystallin family protein [Candidatus Anaeroferrophillacea bacterium]
MSNRYGTSFDDLLTMKEQMDKLFRTTMNKVGGQSEPRQGHWFPPIDLYDCGDDLRLEIELPGVRQEDIELTVEGDVLHLTGRRQAVEAGSRDRIVRLERPTGRFDRHFKLPARVDDQRVDATLAEGVLTVRLIRSAAERKKVIPVNVASE